MGWEELEPAQDQEGETDGGAEGAAEEEKERIWAEHYQVADQRPGDTPQVQCYRFGEHSKWLGTSDQLCVVWGCPGKF